MRPLSPSHRGQMIVMRLILAVLTALFLAVQATGSTAQDAPMQALLQQHADTIVKSSRRTIGPAIDAIAASGLEQAQTVLQKWQARAMWQRDSDGRATAYDAIRRQSPDCNFGSRTWIFTIRLLTWPSHS